MQDMDLAFEMSRLGSNLRGEFPNMPWGNRRWAAARATSRCHCRPRSTPGERMHDYEDLDRSLRGDYPGATVGRDADATRLLQRILGEPAVRDLPAGQGGRASLGEGGPGEPGRFFPPLSRRSRRGARARWGSAR